MQSLMQSGSIWSLGEKIVMALFSGVQQFDRKEAYSGGGIVVYGVETMPWMIFTTVVGIGYLIVECILGTGSHGKLYLAQNLVLKPCSSGISLVFYFWGKWDC